MEDPAHGLHGLQLDSPEQIIDELTYRCYADNRATNPEVEPAEWRTVFGIATGRFEQRYQMELSARIGECRRAVQMEVRS